MSNSSISEEAASDSSASPSETPLLTNDLVPSEQDFLKGVYQSDCSDTEISPEDVVERTYLSCILLFSIFPLCA